jgi:hypothetical protein
VTFKPWGAEEQARFLADLLGASIELRPWGGAHAIHIGADLERGRMFAGDAYGLIFGGWSDAKAALQSEWARQAFEIAKAWKEGQRVRLWGWSGVHGAPSWREVILTGHRDKALKGLGIRETSGQPAGVVEAYRLAPLEPPKAPPGFEVFQTPSGYWAWERQDGAGCGVGYPDRDAAVTAALLRWREA